MITGRDPDCLVKKTLKEKKKGQECSSIIQHRFGLKLLTWKIDFIEDLTPRGKRLKLAPAWCIC